MTRKKDLRLRRRAEKRRWKDRGKKDRRTQRGYPSTIVFHDIGPLGTAEAEREYQRGRHGIDWRGFVTISAFRSLVRVTGRLTSKLGSFFRRYDDQ